MKALLALGPAVLFGTLLGAAPAAAVAPPEFDPLKVAALIVQLDDDDFDIRDAADRELRRAGKAHLPVLRHEQEHNDSLEVRKRVESILRELTADERIPDLIRQLGDTREDFRDQADWELRQYGRVVVPLLRKELSPSLDVDRRKRVERIIADLTPRKK